MKTLKAFYLSGQPVMNKPVALPEESLFKKIYLIRDQKVLLDVDLAELYGVETKN